MLGRYFFHRGTPNDRPVLRRGDLSFMQPLGTTPTARRCGGRRAAWGLAAVPVGKIKLAKRAWILGETETKFAMLPKKGRF